MQILTISTSLEEDDYQIDKVTWKDNIPIISEKKSEMIYVLCLI